MSDPSEAFNNAWEMLTAQARAENLLGGGYDRPLQILLEATRESDLRRYYPFTSTARLCFARSSKFPFEDIQPVTVEFHTDGTYIVRRGGPYTEGEEPPIELKTADASAAVAAVSRVLGLEWNDPAGS